MLIALTEKLYVAPQISVETVAEAAKLGVSLVVNNRPEGESADQTAGQDIEAAARAEGLAYVAIPVTHAGFAPWQIDALDTAAGYDTAPIRQIMEALAADAKA